MSEDYQLHWGHLKEALSLLFNGSAQQPSTHKISFEETYSAVYKCVCDHQAERLHADLMDHIGGVLRGWRNQLESAAGGSDADLINQLERCTVKYMAAVPVIVPIFAYMNRFYVASKLCTDLQTLLLALYAHLITDPIAEKVIQILSESRSRPFSIPPATMMSLVQNLHKINPKYSQANPALFSAYIAGAGINPPMVEADLEAQRIADARLQEQLRRSGFNTSDQTRKRRGCQLSDAADD